MADTTPLVVTLEGVDPGVGTANADDKFVVGVAPFAGTVTAVTFIPEADITGAATNHRALRVRNCGSVDGTGTTVIAELAFDNGVNATAFTAKTIPLSATAANLVVAAGDVIQLFSDAVLTGITDPGGMVRVTISRS